MKSRNFIESFKFAIDGLIFAFKKEKNLKIQSIIGLSVIFLAILIDLENSEILWIFLAVFLVIGCELLNTLIERICDSLSKHNYDLDVKIIKDMSAGLVLTISFFSIVVGVIAFGKKLFESTNFVAFIVYGFYVAYFLISSMINIKNRGG